MKKEKRGSLYEQRWNLVLMLVGRGGAIRKKKGKPKEDLPETISVPTTNRFRKRKKNHLQRKKESLRERRGVNIGFPTHWTGERGKKTKRAGP